MSSHEATTTTIFHQYQRLPDELKLNIWRHFAEAEAASRLVIVTKSLPEEEPEGENAQHPLMALRVLPLKRLISPLFSVNVMTREVALRHYATRVDIYERDIPCTFRPNTAWEAPEEREVTPRHPVAYRFPGIPVWKDRERWCREREERLSETTEDCLCSDESDVEMQSRHRGCVYLNLATDRFFPEEQWYRWDQPRSYGLRAVRAFNEFKYNATPFDLKAILDRRPPVLRNASMPLSEHVRHNIRQVVFPSYAPALTDDDAEGWRLLYDPVPYTMPGELVHAMDIFTSVSWEKTLPNTFEDMGSSDDDTEEEASDDGDASDASSNEDDSSDSGSSSDTPSATGSSSAANPSNDCATWGFQVTDEMLRTFFDDIEEKGPEHLHIQRAVQKRSERGANQWKLVWA
ncbi:hypothetical protein PG996_000079 [Apiospora saccharicola]|uniref:2EXR domain-containing protein n=1 Tax=Apiospora saccharicola TaxID=335842 RepID=A0ABR1WCQ4_9PEZI